MRILRGGCWLPVALSLLAPTGALGLSFSSDLSSIVIDGRPGQVANRTFELHLGDEGKTTQFTARVEDWWASEDGSRSYYRTPGTVPHSCGPWIELNPVEARVEPGGTLQVRVTTSIPPDAGPGGFWCVLTVDELPDPFTVTTSVEVKFLASISVGIFVYLPAVERAALITEVAIDGATASVTLLNQGNAPSRVDGQFEFYRVGETVPVAVASLPRTTLLLDPAPTRRITVELPSTDVLPPGRYLVRAVLDIGIDHYIAAQKEVEIGALRTAPAPDMGASR